MLIARGLGMTSGRKIGLLVGLVDELPGMLAYGGYACLWHLALRLVLWYKGYLRLVPFLDYCAERIFLHKVGDGYIFIHRTLMEYFATLDTIQAPPPAQEPVLENVPTP